MKVTIAEVADNAIAGDVAISRESAAWRAEAIAAIAAPEPIGLLDLVDADAPGLQSITIPARATLARVRAVGAGGGGGGALQSMAGSGGDSGACVECVIPDLVAGAVLEIRVGAGGAPGAPGEPTSLTIEGELLISVPGGAQGLLGGVPGAPTVAGGLKWSEDWCSHVVERPGKRGGAGVIVGWNDPRAAGGAGADSALGAGGHGAYIHGGPRSGVHGGGGGGARAEAGIEQTPGAHGGHGRVCIEFWAL